MAHEIEHRADRHQWSFAFVGDRGQIWHRHGQQAQESWSPAEWQYASGQDFTVSKIPIAGVRKDQSHVGWTDHQLLIRDDTQAPLSVVSSDWHPTQNTDAYAFLQPFIDQKFCTLETAGTLFDGGICFVLVKTREGFSLPGGDETEGYLFVQVSHRYGNADLALPTAVRVVCNNTRKLALQRKSQGQIDAGKFVHRAKTSFSVERANALIEAYRLGLGAYAEQARFLASKTATPEQVRAYVNKVFRIEELTQGTADQIDRRREHNKKVVAALGEALVRQPGANLSPGTWWSAYNSVTWHEDHARHDGKADGEPLYGKFVGASADRKQEAFKHALEFATAA